VTAVVLCIVVVSKFVYGAWIVVVILPILVVALHSVGVHHQRLMRHVRIASANAASRLLSVPLRHHAVITVEHVDRIVLQAVRYAQGLNGQVEAVHVTDDRAQAEELRREWDSVHPGVPLVILESPIRDPSGALLKYLDFIQKHEDPQCFVTVILPELRPSRWWHPLLHNYFAWRVKWVLLFRPRTAVTSVPFEIKD
jgi:hypothetical protein